MTTPIDTQLTLAQLSKLTRQDRRHYDGAGYRRTPSEMTNLSKRKVRNHMARHSRRINRT